jgi:hypothetical protein
MLSNLLRSLIAFGGLLTLAACVSAAETAPVTLQSKLLPGGVNISPRGDAHIANAFRVRTAAVGRGRERALAAEPTRFHRVPGQSASLRTGPVQESYHLARGQVSHDYVILQRPAPSIVNGTLWVDVNIVGGVVTVEGETAVTVQAAGRTFTYSGLQAWDANGTELVARIERREDGFRIAVDDRSATYPIKIDPVWAEQSILYPANLPASTRFGESTLTIGDELFVGATDANGPGGESRVGTVSVYRQTGAVYNLQQVIHNPVPNSRSIFGSRMVHANGRLLISAWSQAVGTEPDAGAVFEFQRVGGVWTHTQTLTGPTGQPLFGNAIAIDGRRLAVTNLGSSSSTPGRVTIFTRPEAGAWTAVQTILPPVSGTEFARSVELAGDRLAVSDFKSGLHEGTVRLYEFNGTSFNLTQSIVGNPALPFTSIGNVMRFQGDDLYISDYKQSSQVPTGTVGAVLQYRRVGGSFTYLQTVTAPAGTGARGFSSDFQVLGNRLVVSSRRFDGTDNGAVFVFARSGDAWNLETRFAFSRVFNSEAFGPSLWLESDRVFVGAPNGAHPNGTVTGVVHVMTYSEATQMELTPSSATVGQSVTGRVTIAGPAPAGGFTFDLGALEPGITVPSTVHIPAGETSGTFTFTSPAQTYDTRRFTIRASHPNFASADAGFTARGDYNSNFVNIDYSSIPTRGAYRGIRYPIQVTVRNDGGTTWTASTVRLRARFDPHRQHFNVETVPLPGGTTVAPGELYTFNITLATPTSPTQNDVFIGWQMERIGTPNIRFGESSPSRTFPLVNGEEAAFVNAVLPTLVPAGRNVDVLYRFRNTGTTTWTSDTHFLISHGPRLNTIWGANQRFFPPTTNVAPNGILEVLIRLRAPSTPGTYNLQWGMFRKGAYDMGSPSPAHSVVVRHANASEFVSQDIPTAMAAGSTRTVSVTYRNVGAIAWKPGQFVLCAVNPFATNRWGIIAVPIASVTNPDGTVTFTFAIKAPSTPGTYNCQWQMRQSGEANFGPMTPNVPIVVN